MKTSNGKLALLAFALLLCSVLLMPLRAGEEDSLQLQPGALKMDPGDSYTLIYVIKYSIYLLNAINGLRLWIKMSRNG